MNVMPKSRFDKLNKIEAINDEDTVEETFWRCSCCGPDVVEEDGRCAKCKGMIFLATRYNRRT